MRNRPGSAAFRCALLAALVLIFTGCNILPPPSVDTTRYYLLTPPSSTELAALPGAGALRLGLRNVELAPYLRKNTLVVRSGGNEVTFPEDARWAEPLDQEIGSALRAGLLRAPAIGRVFPQPFSQETRDYDIAIQVDHCEGVTLSGGKSVARFSALVELTSAAPGGRLLVRKAFAAQDQPWDGKNYGELAQRLSEDVVALSQEVITLLPPVH